MHRTTGRWGPAFGQSNLRVRSPHVQRTEEPNGSIHGGSLFKPYGQLKLTLLAICIDIATFFIIDSSSL